MTAKPESYDAMVKYLQENKNCVPWGTFSNVFRNISKASLTGLFNFERDEMKGWLISLIEPDARAFSAAKRQSIASGEPDALAATAAKKQKTSANSSYPSQTYVGEVPDPPLTTVVAQGKSLFTILPILMCVISFLEEWKCSSRQGIAFQEMRRWLGSIVAAIWICLLDAPFRDQIWVTVQETLGLLFDWTVVDWSEFHSGHEPKKISLLLPERFFRAHASMEENVLESFQDLRHRILTGQWPGETRLLEDRRVTYKQLRFELKDEKKATSVWNRCNPLVLPVQPKFVKGKIASIVAKWWEGNVCKGGSGTIAMESGEIVHFFPSSYAWQDEFSQGDIVRFLLKVEGGKNIAKHMNK